ncbi:polysaccharide pyruvyl transferase family protein [Haliea salexigens]|mgnify:FL=1|uniref:polysaccharide pyruvyl transferase family protein n=1 Tax=Haliea salexigens TaxID=287487 RepID=UPI0011820736|nr:polysaccharide pyruvyl transferase family protein [Haliea salexigens]|tara:strand:- start:30931 stop:31830 length:900 start_codon:yes stop_codon:yes gene_type:complete
MKVIYFQDPEGNFGDELNRWLWPRLFDGAVTGFGHHGIETLEENGKESLLFYGIGTILDDRIPVEPKKIIFGSGFGYGAPLFNLNNCDIRFVRGPKTAEAIGVPIDKALTDPAILLRHFFPVVANENKVHDVSFMPHHSTTKGDFWEDACKDSGINYISPMGFDVEAVVQQISSSRLVIAEAMHAAIVADAFRVPWIPVTSVPETNPFKWQDWCESLDLRYQPHTITPIYRNVTGNPAKDLINKVKALLRRHELRAISKKRGATMLSDTRVLDARRMKMDELVEGLRDHLRIDSAKPPC